MKIEIRLKEVLRSRGWDRYGVIQKIASRTGIHRHQVRKLYHNEATHPSLESLGKICDWLREKGVPASELPDCLIAAAPPQLWAAISSATDVWIMLSEYQVYETRRARADRWVSRHDDEVEADIIKRLSGGKQVSGPQVHTEYVPFRIAINSPARTRSFLRSDAWNAQQTYQRMRSRPPRHAVIWVGSQRVNYGVECLIADLFGCKPFEAVFPSRVPFYLMYRDFDRAVASCFGGAQEPPGYDCSGLPGIYYRDKDRRWVLVPWVDRESDAGVVLTVRDPGDERLDVVMFGVSGRATVTLGKRLTDPELMASTDEFLSHEVTIGPRRVGAYICQINYEPSAEGQDRDFRPGTVTKIIPIAKSILREAAVGAA